MIPGTNKSKAASYGRIVPFTIVEDGENGSSAHPKNETHGAPRRRSPTKSTRASRQRRVEAAEVSDNPAVSLRVQEAFREDVDPTKSLASLRELLIGPVSRLHEARMEEVLTILEEADRATRLSVRTLNARNNEIAGAYQSLLEGSAELNQRVQLLSSTMAAELQKSEKAHDDKLAELFMVFDQKLEKLTIEINQRIGRLEAKTGDDHVALASNVISRIDELTVVTRTAYEQQARHFESQLAEAGANSESQRLSQIDALADGLGELTHRVLALRG
jgi:hypothetical protein